MKVRIVKDYKQWRKDETVDVTPNIAHGLIDRGIARVDRMYTSARTSDRNVKRGNLT